MGFLVVEGAASEDATPEDDKHDERLSGLVSEGDVQPVRFPGPAGAPPAFPGRWSGGELRVSMAGPPAAEVAAVADARLADGVAAPPGTLLSIADPTSPTGLSTRVPGQVLFGRRAPTPQEIAEINRRLAELESHDPALASPNPDLEVSSAPWADPPPRRPSRTPADSPPSAADPGRPASAPSP